MNLDCQTINFSNNFSKKRLKLANEILGTGTVDKLLMFSLHLMGASRESIATSTNLSSETIKSSITRILQNGLIALNDRRMKESIVAIPPKIKAKDNCNIVVDEKSDKITINISGQPISIPTKNHFQLKIFLLTLLNAGVISSQDVSKVLNYSPSHIKIISKNLDDNDAHALIDKRKGQQEFRFTSEVKSDLILQFILDLANDGKTSSELLSDHIKKRIDLVLSPRSVRYHMARLGLVQIKKQIVECLEQVKKNLSNLKTRS